MRTLSLLLVLIEHETEDKVDLDKDQIFALFRKYLDTCCVPRGPLLGDSRGQAFKLLIPNQAHMPCLTNFTEGISLLLFSVSSQIVSIII